MAKIEYVVTKITKDGKKIIDEKIINNYMAKNGFTVECKGIKSDGLKLYYNVHDGSTAEQCTLAALQVAISALKRAYRNSPTDLVTDLLTYCQRYRMQYEHAILADGVNNEWYEMHNDSTRHDIVNTALLGIYDGIASGEDLLSIYANGYKAVNKFFYLLGVNNSSYHGFEPLPLADYDEDGLKKNTIAYLLECNGYVSNDKYFYFDDEKKELLHQIAVKKAIINICNELTPRQKHIFRLYIAGYSENQIAEKCKRTRQTIHANLLTIFKRIISKYQNFDNMLDM